MSERTDGSELFLAKLDERGFMLRLGAAVPLFLLLVGQAEVTTLDGSSTLGVARSPFRWREA